MFKIILLALLACAGPLAGPPDLHGLATWYDPCTAHVSQEDKERCGQQEHLMANGQPYDRQAPTVAVDIGLRDVWLGKRAVVLSECGRVAVVTVTDTGLLAAAGEFRRGVGGLGTLRYWSAYRDDVAWTDDMVLPVVADFPVGFFSRAVCCRPEAAGGPETTVVMVWFQ